MRSIFTTIIGLLLCLEVFAQDKTTSQGATIVSASGVIETAPPKSDTWTAVKMNQTIEVGHRVRAGKKSRAAVRLSNGNIIRVAPDTSFVIPNLIRPTE